MGKSVTIVRFTDEEIRAGLRDPGTLERLLNQAIPSHGPRSCDLHDLWDGVDYLLAGPSAEPQIHLIKRGEVRFEGLSDSAHGFTSAAARSLAGQLETLGVETLRGRYQPERMKDAVYPGRLWIRPESFEDSFQELVKAFERARRFISRVAAEGDGLVVCHFEDL